MFYNEEKLMQDIYDNGYVKGFTAGMSLMGLVAVVIILAIGLWLT